MSAVVCHHRLRMFVAAVGLASSVPLAAQDLAAPRPVAVMTGDAVIVRAPDVAHVTLSIETRAKSPQDAQRQNAQTTAAALERLNRAGVGRDATKTVGLILQQEFDTANGRQVSRGFVARNVVEIRSDDVGRVGEVVDAAVQGGATSVDGIRFDLKDRSTAEREALRLAVADARARAEAAAAGAGRTIDQILRIEDTQLPSGNPRPLMFEARSAAARSTPIEPGTIEIRAHVILTVSIK